MMAESGIMGPPRILLVESDPLIAGTTLRLMRQLGYLTLPPANTVSEARARLRAKPDAVLLEITLRHGEMSLPFADELMAQGVPFAFFSGYYIHDLPARFASCRIVMKPVGDELLTAELLALAGWPGGASAGGGEAGERTRLAPGASGDLHLLTGGSTATDPDVANDP
ncbi:response regulator [Plastoroseomonas hellenica]|uniref:hypothetical protein n=1 Tax=Plastoroseomonas hellenica TaxID=2687306 RepID=UPI001BADABAA|nr:hypothetical protein [Plastoroseomonas hellenica]MBR0647969.1 hypothetical protein [Plastoroseomonas hellenica]